MQERDEAMRRLKLVTAIEAATLVVLVFIAVPLKHIANYSLLVSILGPIHGMAFVTFIWIVISTASSGYLHRSEVGRLLIASVIPFGGFFSIAWMNRREARQ